MQRAYQFIHKRNQRDLQVADKLRASRMFADKQLPEKNHDEQFELMAQLDAVEDSMQFTQASLDQLIAQLHRIPESMNDAFGRLADAATDIAAAYAVSTQQAFSALEAAVNMMQTKRFHDHTSADYYPEEATSNR